MLHTIRNRFLFLDVTCVTLGGIWEPPSSPHTHPPPYSHPPTPNPSSHRIGLATDIHRFSHHVPFHIQIAYEVWIPIVLRRSSSRFHVFSASNACNFTKNLFWGKTTGGKRDKHTESFSDFRGERGTFSYMFHIFQHLLVIAGRLRGDLGELRG